MNKRFKELADEAAKYAATMALPTGESENELFLEKFTELIMEECCKSFQGYTFEQIAVNTLKATLK